MTIEFTECIDKMDGAFYFLESKYARFVDAINSDGEISLNELQLYIGYTAEIDQTFLGNMAMCSADI